MVSKVSWPSCSKLLTTWYSRSERGFRWAIWNTAHNVGGALIPILVVIWRCNSVGERVLSWPGVIGVFIGLIVCWRLRDKPTTMGLPTVGKWRSDHLSWRRRAMDKGCYREILKTYVFSNKYIWLLAFSYVLVYIVRTAVNDWGNLYLLPKNTITVWSTLMRLYLYLRLVALLVRVVAGWGSDRLFGGNRGPMNILFAIGIFLSVSALWLMPLTNFFVFQAAGLFCVGFFVFGPQMLIGMKWRLNVRTSAGAATGFVGLFAYMGAALSGYFIGARSRNLRLSGFFITISTCAAVIGLLLLPSYKHTISPEKCRGSPGF